MNDRPDRQGRAVKPIWVNCPYLTTPPSSPPAAGLRRAQSLFPLRPARLTGKRCRVMPEACRGSVRPAGSMPAGTAIPGSRFPARDERPACRPGMTGPCGTRRRSQETTPPDRRTSARSAAGAQGQYRARPPWQGVGERTGDNTEDRTCRRLHRSRHDAGGARNRPEYATACPPGLSGGRQADPESAGAHRHARTGRLPPAVVVALKNRTPRVSGVACGKTAERRAAQSAGASSLPAGGAMTSLQPHSFCGHTFSVPRRLVVLMVSTGQPHCGQFSATGGFHTA